MTVRDVQQVLEAWAPKELAWERDNVGLQIGSTDQRVRKILVALDVTDEVVDEAVRKKINLLISHHPLLFHPLKSVRADDRVGRLLMKLAQQKITLYSAHTNLDFTASGVSAALAERLELQNTEILLKQTAAYKKIAVYVPPDFAEKIMTAMAQAGAGNVGNYELCSFQSTGVGTFKGMTGTRPFIGSTGILEKTPEVRLEMIAPSWKMQNVISAMKASHPYEEVAYDVYDLTNESEMYGAGIIGDLPKAMPLQSFLAHVRRKLRMNVLRYTGNPRKKMKRVAVCGGSGSDLLRQAIQCKADAFITADVKYHTFQEAEGIITLIDAGHYETEIPIVNNIVDYLTTEFSSRKENIQVFASQQHHNPINYYLS